MKKGISEIDILNWWLSRFHNTTIDEVNKSHPEWNTNPESHVKDFYNTYAITSEQMEEFDNYFYNELPKQLKITQKYWKSHCWAVYLNVAPSEIK